MKIFINLCVFLLLFPIFIQATADNVYKIGIVPWIAWTPLYVAEELGFWKDEGVNVEIINYSNIREKINSFKNGITDLSLGEPADFLPLIEKGVMIKVLLCIDGSFGADKFFIRKDIKLREVECKKIALSPYPAGDFFIERGLKSLKINWENLTFIKVDSPSMAVEAFLGGKVDGAYVYPPSSFRIEEAGIAIELFNSKEFPVYEAIFLREGLSERDNLALKKILKGWLRAAIWASKKENLEKFLEIAKRRMYYRNGKFNYEKWKETMDEIKIFSNPSEIYRINIAEGDFWRYLVEEVDFLLKKKYITKKVLPQNIFHQGIWKSTFEEMFK